MGYIGNANKDSVEYIFDVPQVRIVFCHFEKFSVFTERTTHSAKNLVDCAAYIGISNLMDVVWKIPCN